MQSHPGSPEFGNILVPAGDWMTRDFCVRLEFSGRYGGRSRAAIQASARYAASITASRPTTVRLPP